MGTVLQSSLQPRKKPIQTRSARTVEAIFEATIQVLLRHGPEQFTTTRVAERAGVSVGTLYQYYPNKQSLLFAVLERHLNLVIRAVERACRENHHRPLETMVAAVVHAYVSAKLDQVDASVALHSAASELDGEALVARLAKRARSAMSTMLKTAPEIGSQDVDFPVLMLMSAMAGATRAVLMAGAPPLMVRSLRKHLILLSLAYLRVSIAMANRPIPAYLRRRAP
jgi:AcrR family transcriptional regulator